MSNASSNLRGTTSKWSASPRRRPNLNILKKVMQNNDNQMEIDNLKKEMFLHNQRFKEVYELIKHIESEFRPAVTYISLNQAKINQTLKSYEVMAGKL